MFIVKKKIGKEEYYYLRTSKRENGKVKAVNVAYLGKNKAEAEKKAKKLQEKSLKLTPSKKNTMPNPKELTIDELATFCKRRGFVYPSGEIYGSLAGFWDFGHLGTELQDNIKKQWWKFHVHQREDMVGINGAIITNPKVWEASGHVDSFVDIAIVNKKTGEKSKIDKHELKDLDKNLFEVKGEFNPMFTTQVGPTKEDSITAYLRPETAQLIFTNFKLVQDNARLKLPFGIAQIGKAFRNEISPREFLFRTREFEQMEIEYFTAHNQECPYLNEIKDTEILIFSEEMQTQKAQPKKMKLYQAWKKGIIKNGWHAYWIASEYSWFTSLGANPKKFRARQHTSEEKSHYATDTWDLEYEFPMGWRELQGFANRSDYDLKQHEKFSKTKMEITDPEFGKVLPHVVCEPSLGMGRALIVFLLSAYHYDKERENIVLKLSPKLAPYKAAVFPLISKGEQLELSKEVFKILTEDFNIVFDKSGSIGRRYARNDEIGTPYCITIDNESLEDKTVTIRDRDTTKQIRVKISEIKTILTKLINSEIKFEKAGKLIR